MTVPRQVGKLNEGAEAAGVHAGSPAWMLVGWGGAGVHGRSLACDAGATSDT